MKFVALSIIAVGLCLLQANALTVNGGINILFYGTTVTDFVNTTLNYNYSSLINTKYFNASKPTAFFVHGWGTNITILVNSNLMAAYIGRKDQNVVACDWSKYASNSDYFAVASSVTDQATFVVSMLLQMQAQGMNLASFHFVGHSIGAQMLGSISSKLATSAISFKPTRITGLDPTGVSFSSSNGLSAQHAKFVDVIHTDAGYQGQTWASGHLDFWANGGKSQPACSLFSCLFYGVDDCLSCSHIRALKYYTESVMSLTARKFKSYKCPSTNYTAAACTGSVASMGFYADKYSANTGNYFVATYGLPPYSKSSV